MHIPLLQHLTAGAMAYERTKHMVVSDKRSIACVETPVQHRLWAVTHLILCDWTDGFLVHLRVQSASLVDPRVSVVLPVAHGVQ
jgi:hypothetical protein